MIYALELTKVEVEDTVVIVVFGGQRPAEVQRDWELWHHRQADANAKSGRNPQRFEVGKFIAVGASINEECTASLLELGDLFAYASGGNWEAQFDGTID